MTKTRSTATGDRRRVHIVLSAGLLFVFMAARPALAQPGTELAIGGVYHAALDLGIPEEVEHGIRRKWNIDSGGSGTANPGSGTRNPEEVEHRFRRKWNSGSGGRERSSVA